MVTSANKTSLGYIKEVTAGITPASPNWQLLPVTGNELQGNISTEASAVIRSDRQIDDVVPVDSSVGGTVPFELSYDPWKEIITSLLATGDPDNYSFRKKIEVQGGSDSYFYYRGCQIASLALEFNTASILSANVGIVGLTEEPSASALVGESETAVPAYSIMNSVTSVASVDITGMPAGTEIESMAVNIDNNVTPAKAIGTLGAVDLSQFTMAVGGDINIYFEDVTMFTNFQNSTAFSVTITLEDVDGNQIEIEMPKCKFESLQAPIPGKDQFFFSSGTYRALRGAGGYTVKITHTDA